MVNLTEIYFRNDDAWNDGHKLIINQGGQGSSKTYSILQNIYIISKYSKTRRISTICSYALPHLKLGAIRDFENILISFGENPNKLHNKSDHFFRIGKSIVDYFGIRDNLSKVMGPRRDFLFINEINNRITYEDFDQLNQRTRECTWVDYNPRNEFFFHEKVFPLFDHKLIKSTFRDNPWLPQSEKERILAKYKALETARKQGNELVIKPLENWIRVYADGELGQFEGVIFPNWEYGEFDDTLPFGFGLDFGFTNDPDAMCKVAIDRKQKTIYADECFYKTGQLPGELKESVGRYARKIDIITADSADPRMIANLRKDFNIRGVKKTGQIGEWIRLMQDYKWIITEGSYNLQKELSNYIWSDRKAGIPVDAFDHLISGVRYCFMQGTQTRIATKAY